jgi:malonate-semialdehyde dehydrogenase (acetylating)/methylmalonate-semialdehyde dehydrogenase
MSITCGNTFILKPSERVAGTGEIMIDLLEQAGVPKGVVNVAQGARDTVNYMCDHEDIKAISFVGGNGAGEHIYKRASQRGCRVQSNMGAKNHAIVMPDAEKDGAINAMIGACFGSAGQRCMAQTVSIMVGDTQDWIPEIVERTKKLTVGHGKENPDVTALCGKDALERARRIIANSESDGSKILLDGRDI